MESMEKNDVCILVNFNWVFHRNVDPRIHLPVHIFPDILGVSWNRSRLVSDDCSIIIDISKPSTMNILLPFQTNGHWIGDLRNRS